MNESTPKKRSGNATIEAVVVVLFIVAIICAVAMPSFVRPRSHSCQNACINTTTHRMPVQM